MNYVLAFMTERQPVSPDETGKGLALLCVHITEISKTSVLLIPIIKKHVSARLFCSASVHVSNSTFHPSQQTKYLHTKMIEVYTFHSIQNLNKA